MKTLAPEIPVYYLISYEDVSQEDIDFAVNNHLDGMDIHVFLPDDYVNAVKASGLDIIVWTIDDFDNAERFYRLGVNAITTNTLTQETPEGSFWQQLIWSDAVCAPTVLPESGTDLKSRKTPPGRWFP